MSYSVIDPQIEEVLDLDTGEYLRADMLIGSDYGSVMRLRMALRTDIAGEKPRYGCGLCGVPVYLVRMAQAERFFFRHLLEDGRCVAHTRGQLSEKEILARKYDGAKESRLHLQMKEWIARSLAADPSFSDIQTESTWTSIGTGRRRRPDVRARHGDLPVAFEVQLSTTFIRVIAERRQFYLSEGGLLFWVFGRFGEQDRRLTEDDVFYNNNRNAFVVNAQTTETSALTSQFHLDCYWSDPAYAEEGPLQYRRVSFAELILDSANQRSFYFDYDGHLALEHDRQREQQLAADAELRRRFDAFWIAFMNAGLSNDDIWRDLQREFDSRGVMLPRYPSELSRQLLNALYSAREGKPVGFGFSTFIEIAHWIASGHKGYLRAFRHALDVYGRADQLRAEDRTGKWRTKVAGYKPKLAAGDPAYSPIEPHPQLMRFLFPELY